jgi:hypothetical protein
MKNIRGQLVCIFTFLLLSTITLAAAPGIHRPADPGIHHPLAPSDPCMPTPDTIKNEVFVLGTLYKRHETTPAFGLEALKKVITAIHPDVFVLDISPKELKEQKVYPGKVEYINIVFPYLNGGKFIAYPGEPGEPLYTALVNEAIKGYGDLGRQQPALSKSLTDYTTALYGIMTASWKSVADANSALTDQLLAAKLSLEDSLVGKLQSSGWEKWNAHTTGIIQQAIRENPGRRILVLTGIENAYMIRDNLRRANVDLVDMEIWLRSRGL